MCLSLMKSTEEILSQIFGELMMLIEADKRGPKYGLPLVYSLPGEPRFLMF